MVGNLPVMASQWQWVGNLITAVATIAGVLVGQVFTRRTELAKARKEDATRWLQDRRQVYAAFLAAATEMRFVADYFEMYDLGDPHHPKIDQRRKELGSAHELIYLIAPAEVVKQADRVRAALHDLWSDSHDKMGALAVGAPGEVRTGGTTDQVPLVESILEASIAFRNAARRDLGAEDGLSASRAGKVGMAVS
jgi:hypothetical protein